jgi:hypothetical protein
MKADQVLITPKANIKIMMEKLQKTTSTDVETMFNIETPIGL